MGIGTYAPVVVITVEAGRMLVTVDAGIVVWYVVVCVMLVVKVTVTGGGVETTVRVMVEAGCVSVCLSVDVPPGAVLITMDVVW